MIPALLNGLTENGKSWVVPPALWQCWSHLKLLFERTVFRRVVRSALVILICSTAVCNNYQCSYIVEIMMMDHTIGSNGDKYLLGDDKLTDLLKTGVGGGLSLKGKPERLRL